MAKRSMLEREKKRKKIVDSHIKRRLELRKISLDMSITPEERFSARQELAKLPKNSSPNRLRNRCSVTGRPRGYMRYFGLSRITFRKLALEGELPGVRKGSL